MLTLQHLSFDDCLAGAAGAQRREWAKVQGRFEDIAFVESPGPDPEPLSRLFLKFVMINFALEFPNGPNQRPTNAFAWHRGTCQSRSGSSLLPPPPLGLFGTTRTVQPLRATRAHSLLLPCRARCSRRVVILVRDFGHQEKPLPSLGLDAIYDYFVASGVLNGSTSGQSSRWIEIASRLRDSYGLSLPQKRLAKAVALLNLISTSGTLRASQEILRLVDRDAEETLVELEEAGIVTYREFADEYRVWHGTDVDIRGLVDAALQQVKRKPLLEILDSVHQPRPMVAARHSAERDVLRMFSVRYFDGGQVEPLDAFSQYDGEILLLVGDPTSVPCLGSSAVGAKPVVAAIPAEVTALAESADEVAAVRFALEDPVITEDWVAKRELGERLAQSQAMFDQVAADAFSADTCRWFLLGESENLELQAGRGSSALSQACDEVYQFTPSVGNEMLNRTDLTTQGSKARRLLLEGMIEHGDEPDLGFEGYGPEMAMYRAFLERTNIHVHTTRKVAGAFGEPSDESLSEAWSVMESEFNRAKARRVNLRDVYAALLLPPVGMKAGVAPVFVTAGLLASADTVALYEHGTFKPLLTPEISERMVRNPGAFSFKSTSPTQPAPATRLYARSPSD